MENKNSQYVQHSYTGKVYKVTYDDGSVEYLNEHNPKLIKLRGNSNESNSGN